MNILFRADSSHEIGHGHIMRDLVLAKEFKEEGHNVIFGVREFDGNVTHRILYPTIQIDFGSEEELEYIINEFPFDMVVFDHYDIDESYERYIKEHTGVKIMSFDDTYQPHYCDILLNHNVFAEPKKYKGLVPDGCEIRCGGEYTLIRDEFKLIKNSNKPNNERKKVIIALGASDVKNLTTTVINVLKEFEVDIEVVTTSANQLLDELEQREDIKLHVDTVRMAEVIWRADLMIVSPSVILHEVMYLGLNYVAIKSAENQKHFVKYLQERGDNIIEEYSDEALRQVLQKELS